MAAAASKFPSHKKVGSSDAEEIKVASVHFLSRSSNATGDPASPGNAYGLAISIPSFFDGRDTYSSF